MIAQRYVLGFAFTWDDLIAVARERARYCGRRQKVTRDEDTWLIVTTPEPLTRPAATTGREADDA